MKFSRERIIYITVEEMNVHLKYVFEYYNVIYRAKRGDETFKRNAYIEDKLVQFKLSYKKGSYACTYICKKDESTMSQYTNGGEAFRILSKYYKVPRMDKKYCGRAAEGGLSASPILWYNEKYEKQWVKAWCYDLNSAYSAAMLEKMPDTSKPMRSGVIKENEIGFEEVLNPKNPEVTMLIPKYSGFSLYIFPLMESPFKNFVKTWYDKKANSLPGSKEKAKAKGVLNMSVGQLQNINPFLRATIIGHCNKIIEALIDENTLFCNTDSIVSLKPLDLDFGNNVGQWKIEHEGEVAYIGANYQWRLNGKETEISYRGIPKSWFPKDFDITKDDVPKFGNVWEFKNNRLERIKYEKF